MSSLDSFMIITLNILSVRLLISSLLCSFLGFHPILYLELIPLSPYFDYFFSFFIFTYQVSYVSSPWRSGLSMTGPMGLNSTLIWSLGYML